MTGRGIDRILRHPGDPHVHERGVASADTYVRLAEAEVGAIPRQVDPAYVWGDALGVLDELAPDALIVNLETAVTDRGRPWPNKGIHYRMNPANAEVLSVAGIDVVSLANNHVLDWSRPGLEQTLDVLRESGLRSAGAGRDSAEAWAPAVVSSPRARIAVLAVASPSSGVPLSWSAGDGEAGVAVIPDLSDRSVARVTEALRDAAGPEDVIVLSIHWGPNWGHDIPTKRRAFARAVIDAAGVDVVHGHSSHHPLGVEVHEGRLIIHGCGDLLTDYEGITGHEEYRGELGGLWLVDVDAASGALRRLELVPTRVRGFRLTTPGRADLEWLTRSLDAQCRQLGTRMRLEPWGHLALEW
jgi:poly-gamma-glutamate synthesis protein (capsule biosynthesis protein)